MTREEYSTVSTALSELVAFDEHVGGVVHPNYMGRLARIIARLRRITDAYEKEHPRS